MNVLPILLLGGSLLFAAPALAQQSGGADAQRDILLQKIKADKKLLVSMNMDLTDEEAKNFWLAYDDYQKELDQLNGRLGKAINEFAQTMDKGPLSDETAKKLLDEVLAIEDGEVKLKQSTADRLGKVMPMRKVARYLQIETKIRSIIKAELAREIPLAY